MPLKRGVCTVADCGRPHSARGWCRVHYNRWQRRGSISDPPKAALGEPCWVEGCRKSVTKHSARGLCSIHYQRQLSTGSPTGSNAKPAVDRFFEKVELAGDCWRWTNSLDDSGYGMFSAGSERRKSHIVRAHIWSYEYFVDEVPEGLQLDHLCHNPSCTDGTDCVHRRCVNPWHLEPVPPLVNSQRGCGARRKKCPQGHKYTPQNTYINPRGAQVCRKCAAASQARYERKKAA